MVEVDVGEARLDAVDQGDLLVDEQIGVVGNPVRERPERLEALGRAVVGSHVVQAGGQFGNLFHAFQLFRSTISSEESP